MRLIRAAVGSAPGGTGRGAPPRWYSSRTPWAAPAPSPYLRQPPLTGAAGPALPAGSERAARRPHGMTSAPVCAPPLVCGRREQAHAGGTPQRVAAPSSTAGTHSRGQAVSGVRTIIAMSSCHRPPVQSVTSVTSASTTSDAVRKSRSASLVRGDGRRPRRGIRDEAATHVTDVGSGVPDYLFGGADPAEQVLGGCIWTTVLRDTTEMASAAPATASRARPTSGWTPGRTASAPRPRQWSAGTLQEVRRRRANSSTPRTGTGPGSGSGSARISRSGVSLQVEMDIRLDRRIPGRSPRNSATSVSRAVRDCVRRAWRRVRPGVCSANVRWVQKVFSQTRHRAHNSIRTRRPATGQSARHRS